MPASDRTIKPIENVFEFLAIYLKIFQNHFQINVSIHKTPSQANCTFLYFFALPLVFLFAASLPVSS